MIHKAFMLKTHSWQIKNKLKINLEYFFGRKYLLTENVFGPKYHRNQFSFIPKQWFTKHSSSKHIPDRFKTSWKLFLIQTICDSNIFGPKFLLDLSYESQKIHVQNTFLRDSKQILQILEKCFWIKFFLDPKCFWSQTILDPNFF